MVHDLNTTKTAVLHGFAKLNILVVGDLMVDRYLYGSVSRVSPEAPVPVVKLERRSTALGGAANLANNLAHLTVKASLAGFIGDDESGRELLHLAKQHGVDTSAIVTTDQACTVVKTRVLGEHQQLLRIDEEEGAPTGGELHEQLLTGIKKVMASQRIDAILLSDYAKGVCTPDFCTRLIREAKAPVYVDPKGLDWDKYRGARAVKPNLSELAAFAAKMGWPTGDVEKCAALLREHLDLGFVALTLGARGICVVSEEGSLTVPARAKQVFDVSGAGDTVLATLVSALHAGVEMPDAVTLSNLAAADVVGRVGSVPIEQDDLLLALQAESKSETNRKVFTVEDLQHMAKAWRRNGLKIAFTNGCFDLLHAGHVRLLEGAAGCADRLIVGINSDESVRKLKGEGRPLMDEDQRIAVLSALEVVDAIVVYSEDTPNNVLQQIQPEILAKGDDYAKGDVVGHEIVESYGGQVKLIPILPGLVSSKIATGMRGTER